MTKSEFAMQCRGVQIDLHCVKFSVAILFTDIIILVLSTRRVFILI